MQRRHAQELVLPAVVEGRSLFVGEMMMMLLLLGGSGGGRGGTGDDGQVPIDVREGDGNGLAGDLAVVGDLRAPLDHLGAAGGIGGW